ncbi:MAG TPA: hypothetical protein VFO18_04940, partial [Methylomirabilota bacterium]|nr:hypothetical protein [Methylomirabilota bacterium]
MWKAITVVLGVGLAAILVVQAAPAQGPAGQGMPQHPMPQHQPMSGAHGMPGMPAAGPTMPGQDAFGAIAEIVGLLDADPQTDWSRVDLERLRQHLIDMNEVVLRSEVKASQIPGGLVMEVTGGGRTEGAIRAMVLPHAMELDRMPDLTARAEAIPGGVRLTVTSRRPDDAKAVARLRG